MQVFSSQYGRKGIRVGNLCPTRAITWKLGDTSSGTPVAQVEQLVRGNVRKARKRGVAGWTDQREAEAVRFALWQHAENGAEHRHVMGGRVR